MFTESRHGCLENRAVHNAKCIEKEGTIYSAFTLVATILLHVRVPVRQPNKSFKNTQTCDFEGLKFLERGHLVNVARCRIELQDSGVSEECSNHSRTGNARQINAA